MRQLAAPDRTRAEQSAWPLRVITTTPVAARGSPVTRRVACAPCRTLRGAATFMDVAALATSRTKLAVDGAKLPA
jgi:hypothetical protein